MKTDYEIAQAVLEAVERAFGIKDLAEWSRRRRLVKARQLAYLLIRELTDLSALDIAELLGRRDHTTVLRGCRVIKKDPRYMAFVPRLKEEAERLLA